MISFCSHVSVFLATLSRGMRSKPEPEHPLNVSAESTELSNPVHGQSTPTKLAEHGLYDKLPLSLPTSIRLLKIDRVEGQRIECTLEVANLQDKPEYSALSYTWGPPTEEARRNGMKDGRSKFIYCNGRRESITENLFDFLLSKTVHPGRVREWPTQIWIDAICINQDDKQEKSREIQKMTQIYSSAAYTLVWLGNADQYTCEAMDLITDISEANEERFKSLPLDLRYMSLLLERQVAQKHIDGMMSFFSRTYFSRVWIFQEVVASRRCVVFCGHHAMYMRALAVASRNLTNSQWKYALEATHAASTRSEKRMPGIGVPFLLFKTKAYIDRHRTMSLDLLLIHTMAFEAKDKRDQVYALLGLSGDQIAIDYDCDPAHTFTLAAWVLVKTAPDLSFLSFDDHKSNGREKKLPTWVPDFSVSRPGLIRINPVGFTAAGIVHQGFPGSRVPGAGSSHPLQSIMLKGVLLDVILEVGPPSRSDGDSGLTRAYSWQAVETWLNVLDHLDQVYVNGQDRVEVLWRTMCMDCDLGATDDLVSKSPAPPSLRDGFRRWILYQAAVGLREGDIRDGSELKILDRFSHENSNIPTSSEVLQIHHAENSEELIEELWLSAMEFDSAFTKAGHNICRTSRGHLGRCPMLAVHGDQIWIIPGCPVPLVLRKNLSPDRHSLIGDSYVHGFMQGEALEQNQMFDYVVIE